MKWWWNGGVERKAKLLLKKCWTFLTYIFLHQQWKQCLEFTLAKLRGICKYLAGACNSNSHTRGLHYLTFVCKTKQGNQRNEASRLRKCIKKSSALSIHLECEEVSLQIEFTTVKSGNFVTFFTQNIFFHKSMWRYSIFFSGRKFIKKIALDVSMVIFAFGLHLKHNFFIVLQGTKLPSWRVISSAPYIPGRKHEFESLQVISSAGNIL